MKILDICGGIGGFSLAARWCNHECVGYYDIDKQAVSVYNRNFGTKHVATDIKSIKPADFPNHDILCAGYPCQPFSISGLKKGFNDPRGTIIFDILKIIEAKKPKYVLLENVKGFLSCSGGWCFAYVLDSLASLGYSVQYSILNASDIIPQNRERVFIVGYLGEGSAPKVFPISYGSVIPPKTHSGAQSQAQGLQRPVNTIRANYKGVQAGGESYVVHCLQPRSATRPAIVNKTSSGGSGHICKTDGITYCIDTGNSQAIEDVKTGTIRRFTPSEVESLMGFPIGWTVCGNDGKSLKDSPRYRMLGNAVVPAVVQAVMERLV